MQVGCAGGRAGAEGCAGAWHSLAHAGPNTRLSIGAAGISIQPFTPPPSSYPVSMCPAGAARLLAREAEEQACV